MEDVMLKELLRNRQKTALFNIFTCAFIWLFDIRITSLILETYYGEGLGLDIKLSWLILYF